MTENYGSLRLNLKVRSIMSDKPGRNYPIN